MTDIHQGNVHSYGATGRYGGRYRARARAGGSTRLSFIGIWIGNKALLTGARSTPWCNTCSSVWGRVAGLRQTVAPGAASLVTCHPSPSPGPHPRTSEPPSLPPRTSVTPRPSPLSPRERRPASSHQYHGSFTLQRPYLPRRGTYQSILVHFKSLSKVWINIILSRIGLMVYLY